MTIREEFCDDSGAVQHVLAPIDEEAVTGVIFWSARKRQIAYRQCERDSLGFHLLVAALEVMSSDE